jgi:hypothetical protein
MTITALLVICTGLFTALSAGPLTRPAQAGGEPWRWPLTPIPEVVRPFEPPARPWGPGHRGVDLAARPGQPVFAAGTGRVSYAARLAGRGVIAITHGGLRTTYLPVRPSVRPGQRVTAGERIGIVENVPGHCARRPCLHWGLRRGAAYVDPLSLLRVTRVRLLPIWDTPPPYGDGPLGPYDAGPRHRHRGRDGAAAGGGRPDAVRPSLAAALTAGGGTTTLLMLALAPRAAGRRRGHARG